MATTTAGPRERPKNRSKARQNQTTPSEEEVRVLAHQLYERRSDGGADGDAISDWVEAERLLRSK